MADRVCMYGILTRFLKHIVLKIADATLFFFTLVDMKQSLGIKG